MKSQSPHFEKVSPFSTCGHVSYHESYCRNQLLSTCAYNNGTMRLIKSMRLTASVRLIERAQALKVGPSTTCSIPPLEMPRSLRSRWKSILSRVSLEDITSLASYTGRAAHS